MMTSSFRDRLSDLRALTFSCCLLTAPVLWAQDALLQNAKNLIAAKQASQAYQLLSAQEPARAGQPEFDYLLGIAALDSGRITLAIFALERVLAVQPGNNIARAELARAYMASGETDTARSQLQQVQAATDVPDAARQSVQRLLSSLDQSEVKRLRFYVEAGLGHDSNLSGGPSLTSFAVPAIGLTIPLAATSQERGGTAWQLGAGMKFQAPISAQSEITGHISARTTQPTSHKDLDTMQLDGSLGWATTLGSNRYSIAVHLGKLDFDGSVYRRQQGLQAQWLRNLDSNSQFMAFAQYTRLNFEPSPSNRDVGRTVFGAAFGQALSTQTSAYVGFTVGQENGRNGALPTADFKLLGLRAGAEYLFTPQMRAFASLGLEQRRHSAVDAFFLTQRRDVQTDLAVGLNYQLAKTSYGQWQLIPQISHTLRNSNIVIYDMKRTQVGLMGRLDF